MLFKVKVVREPGANPVTGQFVEYSEQELEIEADTLQAAHKLADYLCTLSFSGQVRRTFINGKEHLDERF